MRHAIALLFALLVVQTIFFSVLDQVQQKRIENVEEIVKSANETVFLITEERAQAEKNKLNVFTLLDAIDQVESGGRDNVSDGRDHEIGRFQIRAAFWMDAVEWDKTIGGEYEDCRKYEYARKVVLAYWDRYSDNIDLNGGPITVEQAQYLSRLSNGGPAGNKKLATLPYWEKVKACLQKQIGIVP